MTTTINISSPSVVAVTPAQKDQSYRVAGNNVGVLLIHGLCGTASEMRYVANCQARQGYTVLCPQLAGHCGTRARRAAELMTIIACRAFLAASGLTSGSGFSSA